MGKKASAVAPTNIRSRIVGEGMERPDQLLANPQNWRRHPKEQLAALEGMLDTVGWVQRVIVNRTTGHLVDGHARVELAMRRSEAEERLVLAGLDPIGGLAVTDQAMLDELLASIEQIDDDISRETRIAKLIEEITVTAMLREQTVALAAALRAPGNLTASEKSVELLIEEARKLPPKITY